MKLLEMHHPIEVLSRNGERFKDCEIELISTRKGLKIQFWSMTTDKSPPTLLHLKHIKIIKFLAVYHNGVCVCVVQWYWVGIRAGNWVGKRFSFNITARSDPVALFPNNKRSCLINFGSCCLLVIVFCEVCFLPTRQTLVPYIYNIVFFLILFCVFSKFSLEFFKILQRCKKLIK